MTVHDSLYSLLDHERFLFCCDEWRTKNHCSHIEHRYQSQSYVTTDGQSASLSWNKAPISGLRPYLYYCQTVAGLFVWGALWRED
jgi:hypothetical protein